ncbi:hypothetical protein M4D55_23220 [Metabacillus idriensis]|uniref:hypothetical protein n=1 Tax=Metabacillus idriensis TaxID=324768 RepID=UPI0020404464|nr:hypothetical protein [Metabacillus idriensis]MCM3598673.1 hypothetical protein [Metabacillus idriensis]
MSQDEYEVPIPYCYIWMTKGVMNRAKVFKGYVVGYLKSSEPHMELIRIEGMKAICKKKK